MDFDSDSGSQDGGAKKRSVARRSHKKRKLSKYNKYVSAYLKKHMKSGMTPKQRQKLMKDCGAEWQKTKKGMKGGAEGDSTSSDELSGSASSSSPATGGTHVVTGGQIEGGAKRRKHRKSKSASKKASKKVSKKASKKARKSKSKSKSKKARKTKRSRKMSGGCGVEPKNEALKALLMQRLYSM